MTSGIGPVEPTDCVGASGVVVGVGGIKMDGRRPVGPTTTPSRDDRALPAGAVDKGDGIGCKTTGAMLPVGATAAAELGATAVGDPTVETPSVEELAGGVSSGTGRSEGLGRTMLAGSPTLGPTRGGLEGAACGVSSDF